MRGKGGEERRRRNQEEESKDGLIFKNSQDPVWDLDSSSSRFWSVPDWLCLCSLIHSINTECQALCWMLGHRQEPSRSMPALVGLRQTDTGQMSKIQS